MKKCVHCGEAFSDDLLSCPKNHHYAGDLPKTVVKPSISALRFVLWFLASFLLAAICASVTAVEMFGALLAMCNLYAMPIVGILAVLFGAIELQRKETRAIWPCIGILAGLLLISVAIFLSVSPLRF